MDKEEKTDNESIAVSQREVVNYKAVSFYSKAEAGPKTPASTIATHRKKNIVRELLAN